MFGKPKLQSNKVGIHHKAIIRNHNASLLDPRQHQKKCGAFLCYAVRGYMQNETGYALIP